MGNQTYTGPVRWVIVDDGKDPQKITIERDWEIKVIRREPFWKPGQNTQAQNLLLGLKHCTDKLAIIEDDDYYHPDWLTAVSEMLNHAELVGESHARYYNIRTKTAKTGKNKSHSSLCSTAMRGKAIQTFARVSRPNVRFIDKDLWQRHTDKKLFPTNYVVGIKGMPGRNGIGTGHNSLPVDDQDRSIFKAWVKDHELYAQVGTR
jgi:glycosyltransferase involved in cell wall biosynthesis